MCGCLIFSRASSTHGSGWGVEGFEGEAVAEEENEKAEVELGVEEESRRALDHDNAPQSRRNAKPCIILTEK